MPAPQTVKWFRVKKFEDLESMRQAILESAPFEYHTEDKRDKNDNPICFLGNYQVGSYPRVNAHFAIWFRDNKLEADGMKIISGLQVSNVKSS